MKIVLIGAGSHFTPGLVRDLMRSDSLAGSTLSLVDTNPESLDLSTRIVKRMARETGSDLDVESEPDRRVALNSADFVVTTILVGGLPIAKTDIDIPLEYGVYQTVGDTVGPGGLIRGLRTIPVMVEIARDIEEICPDAWLFNYTNPLTLLSIAVRETTDVKMLGLCHGIGGTIGVLADYLGTTTEEIDFLATGVNHLTWLLDLRVSGRDAYPRLREMLGEGDVTGWPISSMLCRTFGYFPSPGDRHVAEFFPHFLNEKSGGGTRYGLNPRDIDSRIKAKDERLEQMRGQADGTQPLGDLSRPSGEMAVQIMEAMVGNENREFVVNVPNGGCVGNLPGNAIIELHALVGSFGIRRINIEDMPENLLGMIQHRIAQQELVASAALEGNRSTALQAMILDPLVTSIEGAGEMLAELMDASSDYLPQFD